MESHRELAHVVLSTCLSVQKGENVWIESWENTVDLASEIAFACLEIGASPLVTLRTENSWMRSLTEIPRSLLENLSSASRAALEQVGAFVFMLGPQNPIDWSKIPEEKRDLGNVWYTDSNRYAHEWRRIAQRHCVRMLGIEYCLATKERAQTLGLDHEEWRGTMLRGCLADQGEISRRARRVAEIIGEGRKVQVETPFGTDLGFRLGQREPVSSDSIVTKEEAAEGVVKYLPSGCVEVAPEEDSASGTVFYDVSILAQGGRRIEGLSLRFEQGKLVAYSAEHGAEIFENYLKPSQGDVDKFAFFGVGLNPGLKHGFTQDDKVLGGVTIGIGGNEDKGGKNRTPGNRHWWASITQATVKIDETVVLKQGTLLL